MIPLLLAGAGAAVLILPQVSPPRSFWAPVMSGAIAGALAGMILAIPAVTVAAAVAGAALPVSRRRAERRRLEQRTAEAWGDAVAVIRSGVRAGSPIPEAVAQAVDRVPAVLRPRFADVRAALAVGEPLRRALEPLAADDGGRGLVQVLALADDLGAADTGEVLGAYADFLAAAVAQRREIAARHSWNASAARVALAAPWLTVVALGVQPSVRESYASGAGTVLLLVVAVTTAMAYAIMLAIARGALR